MSSTGRPLSSQFVTVHCVTMAPKEAGMSVAVTNAVRFATVIRRIRYMVGCLPSLLPIALNSRDLCFSYEASSTSIFFLYRPYTNTSHKFGLSRITACC